MRWNRKYRWEDWFAAGTFMIIRGRHYFISTSSMAQQVRNAAAQYKFKVRLKELDPELDGASGLRVTARRASGAKDRAATKPSPAKR